jgi:site-specific recombinase
MPNRVSRFHVSVSQNNEILIQITRKEYRYRFFHSRYYSIVGETVIQMVLGMQKELSFGML